MLSRILVIPALIIVLVSTAVACGDDDGSDAPAETTPAGTATSAPTDAPTNGPADEVITVQAVDFAFDPASISAAPGATVEVDLSNDDLASHTFTVDEIGVDLLLAGGESGTVQFTFPDESFEFYCRIHPTQMRGTLQPGG